jgi:hypothetical protein
MVRRLRVVIRMGAGLEDPVFITARTRDVFTIFAGFRPEDLPATLIPVGFSASRKEKAPNSTAKVRRSFDSPAPIFPYHTSLLEMGISLDVAL